MIEIILGALCLIFSTIYFFFAKKSNSIIRSYFIQNDHSNTENYFLGFSIILCTRGNSEMLFSYLPRILDQHYQLFEVLLIYKDFTNEKLDSLLQLADQDTRLKIIELDHTSPYQEKKQAIHFGIEKASYPWIVTIDDDCYPASNNWLNEIAKTISNTKADIILGLSPYIRQSQWTNIWIRFDWIYTTYQLLRAATLDRAIHGVGRNMAFKKSLWTEDYLTKYGEFGAGDDTTLVQFYSHTHRVAVQKKEKVYTQAERDLVSWIYQKSRHIRSGFHISIVDKFFISKPILIIFFFYVTNWIWLSCFSQPLWALLALVLFWAIRALHVSQFLKSISYPSKLFLLIPFIDFFHILTIFILPILAIFIPKKWK